MSLRKNNILLALANSYLVDSPAPSSISYWWNLGSLLGLTLIIQILTGVTLAMHYSSNLELAFISVEHIMRDVNFGWLIRYMHANGASFFFILVYGHMGRGMYYGSYRQPRVLVWIIGVLLFLFMIITAFLGFKKHSPKLNFILQKTNNKLHFNKPFTRNYSTSVPSTKIRGTEKDYSELFKRLNISPVYCFDNLNKEETRKLINKSVKGLSGIYMIINLTTEDYYIGSAATNRFNARFSNHLIYFRGSKLVKLSVKKYGLDNFLFVVLELFPEVVNIENNKELILLEDKYLKTYLPNYNILTEAGSSFGYKHTELTRLKMKENFSDERKEFIGNLNRGKKLSIETIEKIRIAALNRPVKSKEERLNYKGHPRKVFLYDLDYNLINSFNSINDTALTCHCSYKTMQRALTAGHIYVPEKLIPYLSSSLESEFKNLNLTEYSYPFNTSKELKSGMVPGINNRKKYVVTFSVKEKVLS